MKSPLLPALLFLTMLPTLAQATPNSAKSTFDARDFKPDDALMNIYRGDDQISLDGGLGYSSFSGVFLNVDMTYRHFFWDKVALGPIVKGYFNDNYKNISLGVSTRWYFAEFDKWAFSATQNFYTRFHNNYDQWKSIRTLDGETQLTAHYFFTPEVSLDLSLNYDYNLIKSNTSQNLPDSLTSKIGFGINF